jgi:hypothetical protein
MPSCWNDWDFWEVRHVIILFLLIGAFPDLCSGIYASEFLNVCLRTVIAREITFEQSGTTSTFDMHPPFKTISGRLSTKAAHFAQSMCYRDPLSLVPRPASSESKLPCVSDTFLSFSTAQLRICHFLNVSSRSGIHSTCRQFRFGQARGTPRAG